MASCRTHLRLAKEIWINDLDRIRQLFTSIPVEADEGIAGMSFPGPDMDDKTMELWKDYLPPLVFNEEFLQMPLFVANCHSYLGPELRSGVHCWVVRAVGGLANTGQY